MPMMPGKYPPRTRSAEPEVLFEHDAIEVHVQTDPADFIDR